MPADLAGAIVAMDAWFAAGWTVDGELRTRVARVNENPSDPWPPKVDGKLQAWVLIEVENASSDPETFGTPGQNGYLYEGMILLHVYVPVGSGTGQAFTLAAQAGEIFRNKVFYNDVTPGCYVRTRTPDIDGGGQGDDDGAWFRVTASIPYEYRHRA